MSDKVVQKTYEMYECPANQVLSEVLSERFRQDRLWGQQDHDPMVWLAILAEEFGEVAKDVCDSSIALGQGKTEKMLAALKNYRTELIQVAAVACAMVESFDRNEGQTK